jgi:subtilisin family serine protease
MNLILILLALFPRPELVPVGQAELSAALRIQAEPVGVATQSFIVGRSGPCRTAHRSSFRVRGDSPLADRIPGRFVVGFEPGAVGAAGAWVEQQGGSVVRADQTGGCFIVADFPGGDEARDERLAASALGTSGIRYFEPDVRVFATALPNDPYFLPYQWDKWVMYGDQAWDIVGGTMDVKVAVVDNGCDWQHPDLAANFLQGQLGYDFIGNDDDPRPDNTNVPESFHGTHVAGIIAATRNNNEGVAGWSLVQLLAVRVLNDSGSGSSDVVASGIRWAADHGARIINMSLTSSSSATPMEEACQYAAQAGVLLVAASGNDGQQAIGFPAALSQCIAVGASSTDSRLASFSNFGPEQEVVAPGVSILSCVPGGSYGQADGTSMAAPQVSGVAALVLAKDYGLSAAEVRATLDASAIDMGLPGRDMQYGYGLVNAKRAVDLAMLLVSQHTVYRIPYADAGRTTIVRGGLRLPAWVEQASVYDGSGRLIQTGATKSGKLDLRPGTYFVRASPERGLSPHGDCPQGPRTKDEGQRTKPSVTYKLLVLD